MLTILESIELSEQFLEKKGVDAPRMNAEILLADILKCKRMELYLKFDQPLSEVEKQRYREFIRRRGEREPLQYIIGKVEFYGLEFKVSPNVLIPRPETEILVEQVLSEAKSKDNPSILEIGTGSGNIAISLFMNLENASIHSIDISGSAIKTAMENAEMLNMNGSLIFKNVSFENYIAGKEKFDFVVSNPPYVSVEDYDDLEPELLDFEPKIALTDEGDGFTFYKSISSRAHELLKPGGKIFFEIGFGQSSNIQRIMKENNIKNIKVTKDYQNIDRVISGEIE
ncbi:MAG: peptide chain release factor N(5)-glutamine methyltransferase [Melioribacteraceae bacterium]|nr:peptide chain release factor N(5)-glutamine methyltransferase [Melioribacteraceae bacterium]